MTIRIYLDEDSSDTDLLSALRLRGVDVVGALESGMIGRSDEEQLQWCNAHQRVLYNSRKVFWQLLQMLLALAQFKRC